MQHEDPRGETGEVLGKMVVEEAASPAGAVVAETAGREAEVTLTLGWTAADGTVVVDSNRKRYERIALNPEMTVRLEPYEVKVLCVDLLRP